MKSYEFYLDKGVQYRQAVKRSDGAFVPVSVGNIDFIQFLTDWKNGATVTNADGSPASYDDWVAAGNPAAPA